jgi:hypothetical protein
MHGNRSGRYANFMNFPEREEDHHPANEIDHDAIAMRAYEKWESSGRPDGNAESHWYEAERELRERRHGDSPSSDGRHASPTGNAGRHGPAPRARGKADRGSTTRTRMPGIEESATGGENLPA